MNKSVVKALSATLIILVLVVLPLKPWLPLTIKNQYNKTWQLAMNGYHFSAAHTFEQLSKEYYNTSNYSSSILFAREFCLACDYNDNGDYKHAKSKVDYKVTPTLNDRSNYPKLTEEQESYVRKMVNAINENYEAHRAEYEEEDRKKNEAEKARKEREEAKKREAPYVGMSEQKIDSTDLGRHSEYYKNFNTETISGEIYHASMYYWNSGSETIFTARCVNGAVYNVWDNRDRHVKNNKDVNSSKSSNSSTTKKKSTTTKKETTTEFDPDDHDIDLYYEDYKDVEGFEDIDDAYDDFEDNPEYWDDY